MWTWGVDFNLLLVNIFWFANRASMACRFLVSLMRNAAHRAPHSVNMLRMLCDRSVPTALVRKDVGYTPEVVKLPTHDAAPNLHLASFLLRKKKSLRLPMSRLVRKSVVRKGTALPLPRPK